ncbi:MAG: ATP-binding protein [Tepidisphaeraceae bacterium]
MAHHPSSSAPPTSSPADSTGRPPQPLEMKITSDPGDLRPARLALEQYAANAGMAAQHVEEVGLVLNEALANVMRHGYGGAHDKPILLTFAVRGQGPAAELLVQIRDWAKPFDPAKLPKEPPPVDPDRIQPGGLGLLCMRRMMDLVNFIPQTDGMLLIMTRKIAAPRRPSLP